MHTEELTQYVAKARIFAQSHIKQVIAGTALVAVAVVSIGGIGVALHNGGRVMYDGRGGHRYERHDKHARGGMQRVSREGRGVERTGAELMLPRNVLPEPAVSTQDVAPVSSEPVVQ